MEKKCFDELVSCIEDALEFMPDDATGVLETEKVQVVAAIDKDVKLEAEKVFAELGIDLSTAIDIFLRQTIRENDLPFCIERGVPNADVIAAMKDLESFEKDPEFFKSYDTIKGIMKDFVEQNSQ
jgi:DNA-damage-inducible protein J